jgi:uncharacterized OsmC-like protein
MAEKIRFEYEDLKTFAEGDLDTRGRKGLADVPVHYQAVRLKIQIRSDEPEKKLKRLQDLVARYCPVDSFVRTAVSDYEVVWERVN